MDIEEQPEVPLVRLIALQRLRYAEIKNQVGDLATSIITYPERNVIKLKTLLQILDNKDNDPGYKLAFVQIQTLVAYSLLEVFKDILPNYRVKEKFDDEHDGKGRKLKLKKVTQKMREYEEHLIKSYKVFILRMERMIECLKPLKRRKSAFYTGMIDSEVAAERIGLVGVKCLCNIVIANPNFNFRDQIINIIASLLPNKNSKASRICCDTFTTLYRQDKLGELSLAAVKATAKAIKGVSLRVDPRVFETFLQLKIKEVKKEEQSKDMKLIRGKLEKMSRKEKKRSKKMLKLENQLLETEAQESVKKRLDYHTETLSNLFFVYFRLLRQVCEKGIDEELKESNRCLTPVLQGLSKFCHLINVDFYDDLIGLMYKLLINGTLTNSQTLCCLQTVFTILSDDGYALNIDPQRFYAQLYHCLLNLDSELEQIDENVRVLQTCIDKMILKRRKQMSTARAQAFAKRLATVSMHCQSSVAASLLSSIRSIAQNHKQCDLMLDTESSGSGLFMPQLADPEYCNASSTKLWELHSLRKHCDPMSRRFAAYLINNMKGNELNGEILKRTPLEVYELTKEQNEKFVDTNDPSPRQVGKRKFNAYLFSADSLFSQEMKKIKTK